MVLPRGDAERLGQKPADRQQDHAFQGIEDQLRNVIDVGWSSLEQVGYGNRDITRNQWGALWPPRPNCGNDRCLPRISVSSTSSLGRHWRPFDDELEEKHR